MLLPTDTTSERSVSTSARPWPNARRSDARGPARRRASRLRLPAFMLVGAAAVVALVPVPAVDTRLAVGVLLVLGAAAFARMLTDRS